MTNPSPKKAAPRARRVVLDTSLVRMAPAHSTTPDFVTACIAVNGFITCVTCSKVVGIGTNKDEARKDAVDNGTGIARAGGWYCRSDAPKVIE